MGKIWLSSDWHFCHNKEFLYGPRGFSSIEEANEEIVRRHNEVVAEDDDVYVLGDLMLGNNDIGMSYIEKMNGNIHVILGNHDTNTRLEIYKNSSKIKSIQYAYQINLRKYTFYLSHYPTYMGNYDLQMSKVWCLHGHTHFKEKFGDIDKNYNVALDAHNCYPVDLETIVKDIQNKWNEIHKTQVMSK